LDAPHRLWVNEWEKFEDLLKVMRR